MISLPHMDTKKRILVVDDEPGILRFVRVSLTLAGYSVTTALSGEEALKLVRLERPDVVLLDILMVPMDGLKVLETLRSFSRVPVIVLTARISLAGEAMERGANSFIAKPFLPEALVKEIEDVLKKSEPEAAKSP